MPRFGWLAFPLAAPVLFAQFSVGVGRRDITPKEPTPMWGYGDRHSALSTGTIDPLFAEALVIQAGERKLAIVGLDLGRSPNERSLQNIRERIRTGAGIEWSMIAGSHTHHAPVLEFTDEPGKGKGKFDATLRYYTQLEDAVVAAVLDANAKLAPARLATGVVRTEGFNRNRHTKVEPKSLDRDLAVMRFDDPSGKPIAILVNFAAHPTTLPSADRRFSPDYVGVLKAVVTRETGATAFFMQGASGDQSVTAKGDAIGMEAVKLAKSLQPEPVAKPSIELREERFRFASRTDFSSPAVQLMYSVAFFPELVSNYVEEYRDGVRPRLTVALLNGEIALVAASGEFFGNHAIRLRERARVKQLFFFGYANGYHQCFPTIEAVAEGGYGADATVSPVAVGAGEQLMNTALTWIYGFLGKIKL
jgi:neutral ceramidase